MKSIFKDMYASLCGRAGARRGFTLLIAVLISSLMLILAGAMFNLVQKEVILSTTGRDSEYAFYAADSAVECALYWDFQKQAFSNGSGGPPIVCDNVTATATTFAGGAPGSIDYPGLEKSMELQYESGGLCARISVTKHAASPKTTIQGRGYNVSCAVLAASPPDPRALERAVEVNY